MKVDGACVFPKDKILSEGPFGKLNFKSLFYGVTIKL